LKLLFMGIVFSAAGLWLTAHGNEGGALCIVGGVMLLLGASS